MLVKEFDVSPDDRFYVLKYRTNDKARSFVANRVQTITDTTAPHEWHYVDSALNPVDDASRGLKMSRFLENKRWINGPSFLWKATDEWPKRPVDVSVNTLDDPEVAPRRDRNRRNRGDSSTQDMTPKPVMVEELEKAEVTIVKIVQAEPFPDEISALKRVEDSSKVNNRSLTKQKMTNTQKAKLIDGRKELKRYGVLFTCLNSRAIHLESANCLETDSFLNALRRFIARRGPVREIRSDRAANLIGAAKDLKDALKEMDNAKINEYLCRHSDADWVVRWKPNPPAASHMGGVWERQIRTVRTILTSLMKEFGHVLNDESFRTLLTEAECIVNSRPLTFPSSDPTDLGSPISPSNILTMKSKIVMPPPGNFQRADLYLRKRWKRVQYLVEIFWTRWKREYLNTLQMRKKWNRPQRSFEIGDVVPVLDERTSINLWPLARFIDITPDSVSAVRSVKAKTATSTLERPIVKLVILLENS
ncbi:OTU domain-containing [Paramuricea clavata]|uniref:OTU domain-containing n=1 Tax=Paramuricea clavata TaxID=317549 RepID=A0A6S7H4C8_PARCT|nr:OTU domain-containing [Paramuricea clavata]